MRISFKELTTSQLDMAIMGQLLAFTNTSPGPSTSNKLPHERKSNSPSPISLTCMVKNHTPQTHSLFNSADTCHTEGYFEGTNFCAPYRLAGFHLGF